MRDSNKDYHAAFLPLSVRTSLPLNSHFNRFPFSRALYFHPLSFSFFPPLTLSPLFPLLSCTFSHIRFFFFFFSSRVYMYILAYRVPPWFALDLFVSCWRANLGVCVAHAGMRARARGRSPDSFLICKRAKPSVIAELI